MHFLGVHVCGDRIDKFLDKNIPRRMLIAEQEKQEEETVLKQLKAEKFLERRTAQLLGSGDATAFLGKHEEERTLSRRGCACEKGRKNRRESLLVVPRTQYWDNSQADDFRRERGSWTRDTNIGRGRRRGEYRRGPRSGDLGAAGGVASAAEAAVRRLATGRGTLESKFRVASVCSRHSSGVTPFSPPVRRRDDKTRHGRRSEGARMRRGSGRR